MNLHPQKILIIQTAFLGDAILATSVAEELHAAFPHAQIFLLVKKGNEGIFEHHPFLNILVHDKTKKYSSLWNLIKHIRKEKFDVVINLHRYLSSNLLTIFSGAKFTAGFKSPFSFLFTHQATHQFKKGIHEIHRYHSLAKNITKFSEAFLPKLYPDESLNVKIPLSKNYVCFFPGSIWATKQLPPSKWIELSNKISSATDIYLCGSASEKSLCEYIKAKSGRENIYNYAGQFSLSELLSVIKQSKRVYCNDSAPLHIASALNVPATAFFCSTVTDFGFYPLSSKSEVIEVKDLNCRPCGIHGYKECPKHHFQCGLLINIDDVTIE